MIKSISAVLLLFLGTAMLMSQDPVSVKMTVPSVVGAGQEFRISITVFFVIDPVWGKFPQELRLDTSS